MREEVRTLLSLGPFPAEDACTVEEVDRHEQAYRAIARPLTDEEASELVKLFGPDDYFGLALSLVHLLETAPSWPLHEAITHAHPLWAKELRMRYVRGGV